MSDDLVQTTVRVTETQKEYVEEREDISLAGLLREKVDAVMEDDDEW